MIQNNLIFKIITRDNYTCQRCKEKGASHVGHRTLLKPESELDAEENLITLCFGCEQIEKLKSVLMDTLLTAYNKQPD